MDGKLVVKAAAAAERRVDLVRGAAHTQHEDARALLAQRLVMLTRVRARARARFRARLRSGNRLSWRSAWGGPRFGLGFGLGFGRS